MNNWKKPNIEIIQGDCEDYMAKLQDKSYNLAIVDPPYNVGASDGSFGGKSKSPSKVYGVGGGKHYANHDKTPNEVYFNHLFRISKSQIIWGSNYYPQHLRHSGAIVWDKVNDTNPVLSDCEIAFQSFNKQVKIYRQMWSGFAKGGDKHIRIHPNQKPVALYKWILLNYAKEGDRIIDTHGGSMSLALACWDMGFDCTLIELNEDYYIEGLKRFNEYSRQDRLLK